MGTAGKSRTQMELTARCFEAHRVQLPALPESRVYRSACRSLSTASPAASKSATRDRPSGQGE